MGSGTITGGPTLFISGNVTTGANKGNAQVQQEYVCIVLIQAVMWIQQDK